MANSSRPRQPGRHSYVAGVSLTTGTRYQANLTDNEYQRTSTLGVAADFSINDDYELVSLSPTPNMIVRFAFSVHIGENGIATPGVNSMSAKCAGAGGSSALP